MTNSLEMLIEHSKTRALLSREDEHDLAVLARAGDEVARAKLVESNLRFVMSVALQYRRYGIPVGDLVSEGNLGLVIASKKFDPDRGTRFVTYAGYWIRAFVLDLVVRSTTMVGAGSGPFRSKTFFRLRRERAKLASEIRDPQERLEILAKSFGTTVPKMEEMLLRLDSRDTSLDAPVRSDGDTTLIETIANTLPTPEALLMTAEDERDVSSEVNEALQVLDKRELFILRNRYMGDEEVSLAELGRELGVSRERARQLEARAKEKLKKRLNRLHTERTNLAA